MSDDIEGTGGGMRVAVTGGTGFVGSHVVELLLERGHEVNCLVLPREGALWLELLRDDARYSSRLAFFEGSVTDRSSLAPFLAGCQAIVNVAGLTRCKTEEGFLAVNSGGAVNLVETSLSLSDGPRHIVSMSSLAASGPCDPEDPAIGACLDEDCPQRPLTPYGRSKAALEAALRPYDEEGRMRCTFIRAPGVYGPRDRDFLEYFKLVKRGLRVIVGERNVMSLVYVKTLAQAIVSCLGNPASYGHAFFVADEGEYDWDDFSSMVEASLGKRTLRLQIPEAFVAVVAFFSEAAKPFMKRPPLLDKHKLLEIRQHRWVVSTAKAQRLLGFEPVAPTAEAIAETGRWYQAEGWI
jgi:dihydroflavonol-4-reductase